MTGTPGSLEETYAYLDVLFDDTTLYNFLLLPEDVALGKYRFGIGIYMRNSWGLWKGGALRTYFLNNGVYHADAMSDMILVSYHRYRLHKAVDFDNQVERYRRMNSNVIIDTLSDGSIHVSYPELAKEKRTTVDELMSYFPEGDSVTVTLSAKRKILRQSGLFTALGVISGRKGDKLIVTLTRLEKNKKQKTDHFVGQGIDVRPISCSLIPPKNWKRVE